MTSLTLQNTITTAAELIRSARHAVAFTGAGISTPSGIPDFRSTDQGLWNLFNPMEVASLRVFRYSPEKFYEWLRPLAGKILNAEPNPAHLGLARLEEAGHIKSIITQNIDGLHQRAGSKTVVEVHGTIENLICVDCYQLTMVQEVVDDFLQAGKLPRCPQCGSVLKPNVILFEEQLPYDAWQKATAAIAACDLLFIAGSSLEVVPVAGLPMKALERDVSVIIVNHTKTYINDIAKVVIYEDVAEVIPLIAEEVLRA